ncbi:MAG: response regulator transcription factor [Candidatus Gastranaerophilales bacterium]
MSNYKFGINENKELTERELIVLRKMSMGLSNKQIAKELFVTHHTIKAHVSGIYKKLDVTNRVEASMKARDLGLL